MLVDLPQEILISLAVGYLTMFGAVLVCAWALWRMRDVAWKSMCRRQEEQTERLYREE